MLKSHIFTDLSCTLSEQRPGTAKGGERVRPGRVLVIFTLLYAHIRSGKYNVLLLATTTDYYNWWIQQVTKNLRSGKQELLFEDT